MRWRIKRKLTSVESLESQRLIEDVRRAEQEWSLAEWRFHHALGEDQVDYTIYCLEAAEKKLSMLLRQAKWHWSFKNTQGESRGVE
ncbi:DUF2508 family protein [Cohnella abietis]|uniref:DUF2508 domain-containing protein n=1 Tax=Cohnella abietis TaxID=2507935 RepID=A0A3T1CZ39_9BACL|nr:DUF2508 family protein [Cohnella abietis]BBI31088.1 hypothetical protein KCTCHS21_04870 [Cohnella abietis]